MAHETNYDKRQIYESIWTKDLDLVDKATLCKQQKRLNS